MSGGATGRPRTAPREPLVTLESLLAVELAPERLTEGIKDNRYECPECTTVRGYGRQDATRTHALEVRDTPPDALLYNLKRAAAASYPVHLPPALLRYGATYERDVMLMRDGSSADSSHYYALLREGDGDWTCYNDDSVEPTTWAEVEGDAQLGTVLVSYRRQGAEPRRLTRGLPNLGNGCFVNAALQLLASLPHFRDDVGTVCNYTAVRGVRRVAPALTRALDYMYLLSDDVDDFNDLRDLLKTGGLVEGQQSVVLEQDDVHGFCLRLLLALRLEGARLTPGVPRSTSRSFLTGGMHLRTADLLTADVAELAAAAASPHFCSCTEFLQTATICHRCQVARGQCDAHVFGISLSMPLTEVEALAAAARLLNMESLAPAPLLLPLPSSSLISAGAACPGLSVLSTAAVMIADSTAFSAASVPAAEATPAAPARPLLAGHNGGASSSGGGTDLRSNGRHSALATASAVPLSAVGLLSMLTAAAVAQPRVRRRRRTEVQLHLEASAGVVEPQQPPRRAAAAAAAAAAASVRPRPVRRPGKHLMNGAPAADYFSGVETDGAGGVAAGPTTAGSHPSAARLVSCSSADTSSSAEVDGTGSSDVDALMLDADRVPACPSAVAAVSIAAAAAAVAVANADGGVGGDAVCGRVRLGLEG
jgi:hypothetical protein